MNKDYYKEFWEMYVKSPTMCDEYDHYWEMRKTMTETDRDIPAGWSIEYRQKPIPSKEFDYDFWHEDHDYCTLTGSNGLSGTASSMEDAIRQIRDIEEERGMDGWSQFRQCLQELATDHRGEQDDYIPATWGGAKCDQQQKT